VSDDNAEEFHLERLMQFDPTTLKKSSSKPQTTGDFIVHSDVEPSYKNYACRYPPVIQSEVEDN